MTEDPTPKAYNIDENVRYLAEQFSTLSSRVTTLEGNEQGRALQLASDLNALRRALEAEAVARVTADDSNARFFGDFRALAKVEIENLQRDQSRLFLWVIAGQLLLTAAVMAVGARG